MDPVVMIPGLGSDATVWERTIDELGPDYRCQVGDTLSDSSLEGMALRVLEGAPSRFALAGVSMGGMIAMTIMKIASRRVSRLALFDTNARPDTPEQISSRRETNAAMLAATDLRALAAPGIDYMVHPNTGADVRDALAAMAARVGAAAYVRQNEAVAVREDLLPVLASVNVPALVAVGANDLMTPIAFSQAIADALPKPELHVIPECGHLPPIEKPIATADLLRHWLRL